jgi:nucleoside-diphosphate-sugar epimerase
MSLKVAIIGANGFIGSRLVELFHLGGLAEVRPIVRSINGIASLSKFDLDFRVADARDRSGLRMALEACDAVIYAVAGDRATILKSLDPVYLAAQDAGVKRMVYLSSGSVHGQTPAAGTDESSPLSSRQPIAYNNAKVLAERRLSALRKAGSVELVILRPGIVLGPRSSWVTGFASSLLDGTAYLVDAGRGICNGIYIDNLVHAVHLAITESAADGHAFLVGDDETITWADLYQPIATALGVDLRQVPSIDYCKPAPSLLDLARTMKESALGSTLLSFIPARLRRGLSAALAPTSEPVSVWSISTKPPRPVATLEMAMLYQCKYKLPNAKAARILGYKPVVSHAIGCERIIGWLEFAGYPVKNSRAAQPRKL